MKSGQTVAVIIPAFNEEEAIGKVIEEVPSWVDDVIVVDNGSTDKTARVACQHGVRVIRESRCGYGSACLAGIAALNSPDVVVFMDGDFSDYPQEMELLVETIIHERADMVIGSRTTGRHEPGALTPQAQFGNWFACWLLHLFWRVHYTDLGPFRAIRYSALNTLHMQDRNYGWTVEMQTKAARKGMRIMEVPVSYRRRIGKSKVSGTIKGVIGAGTKILSTIIHEAVASRRYDRLSTREKIIIFTRYPEPGKTKTRLIPVLGNEGAAHLQRSMTEDTINSVLQIKNRPSLSIEIRYDGGNSTLMQQWLGNNVVYRIQGDGDLGKRMSRAFKESFNSGFDRVIIIGTDSPDLDVNLLHNAFDALNANDIVLGPSEDGGYYLIGFKKRSFLPGIFNSINWGSSTVFSDTINMVKKTNHSIHLLPQWNDMDTLDDLKDFIQRNQDTAVKHSKTFSYLQRKWVKGKEEDYHQ